MSKLLCLMVLASLFVILGCDFVPSESPATPTGEEDSATTAPTATRAPESTATDAPAPTVAPTTIATPTLPADEDSGTTVPTATRAPESTATDAPAYTPTPTPPPPSILNTDPRIHNDNVFVLPVEEDLVSRSWDLPLAEYTARFYEYFSDDFDFLVFVANVPSDRIWEAGIDHGAYYIDIRNDVQGIGKSLFADGQMWGNTEQLQGLIYINTYDHQWGGDFVNGVLLHELMHRWANFVVPPYEHWGFISEDCMLDGYDISAMREHGGGRYSIEFDPSFQQYCPIELYLAGLIPPQDVPDFRVAVDGNWLFDEAGNVIEDDSEYRVFSASEIKAYNIEDIVAAHGARIPDASQSQKDFRAAVVLLTGEDYPALPEILGSLSQDVSWFSYPGNRGHPNDSLPLYNFYQATGGRGTIAMDELPRFQKSTL